jgi:hypothetical protein
MLILFKSNKVHSNVFPNSCICDHYFEKIDFCHFQKDLNVFSFHFHWSYFDLSQGSPTNEITLKMQLCPKYPSIYQCCWTFSGFADFQRNVSIALLYYGNNNKKNLKAEFSDCDPRNLTTKSG